MLNRQFWLKLIVICISMFVLLLGSTFNGVVNLTLNRLVLLFMTVSLPIYGVFRWRAGWQWKTNALNLVLVLVSIALLISLVLNLDSVRRIALGLWFWALYVGVWFVITDMIGNGISRRHFVDALLFSGIPLLVLIWPQVQPWFSDWLAVTTYGISAPFKPIRPFSLLNNANALATYLMVISILSLGRMVQCKRHIERVLIGLYVIALSVGLFMTQSRGAWLGLVIGGCAWLLLMLAQWDYLRPARWREVWNRLATQWRIAVVFVAIAAIMAMVLAGVVGFKLVNQPERQVASTRGVIWDSGVNLFVENPIAGTGLFTFGKGFLDLQSTPPITAHSHAHNLPLNIAAELGLLGLGAFVVVCIVVFRMWWRAWRGAFGKTRAEMAALGAALLAYSVHHLFDVTMMMPSVALLALLLAAMFIDEQPIPRKSMQRIVGIAIVCLWGGLMLTAWWSNDMRTDYVDALKLVIDDDYRASGDSLEAVIDRDPTMPLYPAMQGFVYGVAAHRGSEAALLAGIESYEHALALEDVYAPWWANLAALHWQAGDSEGAIRAMQAAVEAAPQSPFLRVWLGIYLEEAGITDEAAKAYVQAIDADPRADIAYASFWQETALRQQVISSYEGDLSKSRGKMRAHYVDLWVAGEYETLRDELLATPKLHIASYAERVMIALAYEALGESERADFWLDSAQLYIQAEQEGFWIAVGNVIIADMRGEPITQATYDRIVAYLIGGPRGVIMGHGAGYTQYQFMRDTFQQQYLPQLNNPIIPEPVRLLDSIR